jgi:hypothetical protein
MKDDWKPVAIAAASLPSHPDYQEARLQQQVATYLLYRSYSADERNRRALAWWHEARRRHAEESH